MKVNGLEIIFPGYVETDQIIPIEEVVLIEHNIPLWYDPIVIAYEQLECVTGSGELHSQAEAWPWITVQVAAVQMVRKRLGVIHQDRCLRTYLISAAQGDRKLIVSQSLFYQVVVGDARSDLHGEVTVKPPCDDQLVKIGVTVLFQGKIILGPGVDHEVSVIRNTDGNLS